MSSTVRLLLCTNTSTIELGSGKNAALSRSATLWFPALDRNPDTHKLIRSLGPEPLGDEFSADYLWQRSRGRRVNVKQFIMNANIVVGVGNIYASEALFLAGINPHRAAGRIALARYEVLADAIRHVLQQAIDAGGTTLRDFYGGDGEAGYFQQELSVYGRDGRAVQAVQAPGFGCSAGAALDVLLQELPDALGRLAP